MIATSSYVPRMRALLLCIALLVSILSSSQSRIDSLLGKLDPQQYADAIGNKSKKLEEKLVSKSVSVLENMRKQEERIYQKMLKGKDSVIARQQLAGIKTRYEEKINKLKEVNAGTLASKGRQYIPILDSFNTSLKFLNDAGVGGKVKEALSKTEVLKAKFDQAEEVTSFIKQRKEELKQQLDRLGIVKNFKKINKQVYYYASQVKEYKEMLKDPKRIEKKALELLAKSEWFHAFMKKNSFFASLFKMPGDPDDPAYLAGFSGLQTRAQVNTIINQQIQSGGAAGRQQFMQQMQDVQSQVNELKNKALRLGSGSGGGGNSDDIMPEGFKPNGMKTKSFLQRLEYGTNIQSQKGTSYFPNTTDLGLSVGYKLNDNKSVIGIGVSYKLGLGRGWDAIKLSNEGLGLRTYMDWKIKGSLWISGGYEMNYKTAFSDFDQLKNMSGWQRSGLLGISKSVPVNARFFKKTKVQLLWDFLSYEQVPRTQPIIFRIEYAFSK